uniref:Uncharacterized protein LOC100369074 n=1 Tax=Saccoglossus kowalevskii TaxID=10224 RepID=A0ABM0GM94_SACKO|nr:PREDICTED: uncharacterized protein LOC100369074 [Saccoglossus kowalevskii]
MAQKKTDGYIMLSYQWDSQGRVQRIRRDLESRGYNVWMDVSGGMKEDIYDSMASAVEKASIVLICVSSKYKASTNCMMEAKYAQDNSKKIIPLIVEKGVKFDGPLGLICSGKLYFELWNDNIYDTKMNELNAEIRSSHLTTNSSEKDLSTANVDEICEWLKQLDIDRETVNHFKRNGVTGDDLADITYEDLVNDLDVKPFIAKKILKRRDKELGRSSAFSHDMSTPKKQSGDGGSKVKPEQIVFRELACELGDELNALGSYLGLTAAALKRITLDNRFSTENQLVEMFLQWRRSLSMSDNKSELLCRALERCGRRDLSEIIAGTHW